MSTLLLEKKPALEVGFLYLVTPEGFKPTTF
jgi:hypothetical protein